jgi:predicted nucleotidyltransferase
MNRVTQQVFDALQTFKKQYESDGVYIVGLFGSYAQGRNDAFSDIDIAYRIDHKLFSEKYKDGFSKILRLEEIKHSLEQLFHKKVDFVSLDSSNKKFIEYIKQEMLHV